MLANKTQLTAVLTYHMVAGKMISIDLKNDMMVKTVQTDIECINGVIHAIDTV